MSLETASYIGQLQIANPTRQDPINQGDDHLRLIKSVLQTQFPGVSGTGFAKAITATEDELNFVHGVTSAIQPQLTRVTNACPIGMIIMWSGTTIPTNWQVCDGTNGTPDLRGRFIWGKSPSNTLNSIGGSADSIVVAHAHGATTTSVASLSASVENQNHSHTFTTNPNSVDHTHTVPTVIGGGTIQGGSGLALGSTSSSGASISHTHNGTTDTENAAHDHTISGTITSTTTVVTAGISPTNANLPPWYVLAYIMLMA